MAIPLDAAGYGEDGEEERAQRAAVPLHQDELRLFVDRLRWLHEQRVLTLDMYKELGSGLDKTIHWLDELVRLRGAAQASQSRPSVNAYAAAYEFRGDQDYTPTEGERAMIEDAIEGYLSLMEAPSPDHPACPCKPARCTYPGCTCALPSAERESGQ